MKICEAHVICRVNDIEILNEEIFEDVYSAIEILNESSDKYEWEVISVDDYVARCMDYAKYVFN